MAIMASRLGFLIFNHAPVLAFPWFPLFGTVFFTCRHTLPFRPRRPLAFFYNSYTVPVNSPFPVFKMRAGFVALALQAASVAYALPQAPDFVPSDPEAALLQLEQLGNATYEAVESDLAEAAEVAKRSGILTGSCTLTKLKIRREWFVPPFSRPPHTPTNTSPGAR